MALKEGLTGAATGAGYGAMSGTPHGVAIGAVTGFIGGMFGGGGGGSDKADDAAKKAHKQALKIHDYNWGETQRGYEYQVDAQNIQKKNALKNIKYTERTNRRNYNHAMAIRKYDFRQANRAYEQSKATAQEQLGFNEQAAEFGKMQQRRAHAEQLVGLLFSENQSLMDYNIETAGLASKKRQLNLQGRAALGQSQNETQRSMVEELEAEGAAQASGSGRSNVKAMQAAIAKAGANQQSIADELMFGLKGIDIGTDDIEIRAAAMRTQLKIDQLMLEATRDNLDARTSDILRKIEMDKEQADAVARARIHLKPELSPAMPKPQALPRPEYLDVYKPKEPPKPKKGVGYSPSSGGFGQALNTLAAATPDILKAFTGGGGYQPNMSLGSVSSLSDFNFSNNSNFNVSDFGTSYGQGLDLGSFGGDISFNTSSLGNFSNLSDPGFL